MEHGGSAPPVTSTAVGSYDPTVLLSGTFDGVPLNFPPDHAHMDGHLPMTAGPYSYAVASTPARQQMHQRQQLQGTMPLQSQTLPMLPLPQPLRQQDHQLYDQHYQQDTQQPQDYVQGRQYDTQWQPRMTSTMSLPPKWNTGFPQQGGTDAPPQNFRRGHASLPPLTRQPPAAILTPQERHQYYQQQWHIPTGEAWQPPDAPQGRPMTAGPPPNLQRSLQASDEAAGAWWLGCLPGQVVPDAVVRSLMLL